MWGCSLFSSSSLRALTRPDFVHHSWAASARIPWRTCCSSRGRPKWLDFSLGCELLLRWGHGGPVAVETNFCDRSSKYNGQKDVWPWTIPEIVVKISEKGPIELCFSSHTRSISPSHPFVCRVLKNHDVILYIWFANQLKLHSGESTGPSYSHSFQDFTQRSNYIVHSFLLLVCHRGIWTMKNFDHLPTLVTSMIKLEPQFNLNLPDKDKTYCLVDNSVEFLNIFFSKFMNKPSCFCLLTDA